MIGAITLGRNVREQIRMSNELRCHVFCLGSMSSSDVDRPFLMHAECAKRVDSLLLIISVQRIK